MFAEFICAHPIGRLASSKTWPAMTSSIGFILGLVDFLAKTHLKFFFYYYFFMLNGMG